MGDEKPSTNGRADGLHKRRDDMNRKEIDLLLARIEGLKSFLEKNSLEDFQKEILRVDNYLKRFGVAGRTAVSPETGGGSSLHGEGVPDHRRGGLLPPSVEKLRLQTDGFEGVYRI